MQQLNCTSGSSPSKYKLTWLKTQVFMTQILLCH